MAIRKGTTEVCKIKKGTTSICKAYRGTTPFFGCHKPPTVDDMDRMFSGGAYTFTVADFTNNFQDPDGDSYSSTTIESLPEVGTIKNLGNPINVGDNLDLVDVGNLTFELPANYQVSSNGYCIYDEDIDQIIADKNAQGYTLNSKKDGVLEFVKETISTIPNETDIYAFFDATSMLIADAEAAASALNSWFNDFKASNTDYTGNLYILPIVKENWLDFPNIVWRGSSDRVRNNSGRPDDDYMAFAQLPPNFNVAHNNENPSWTPPTKILTLCFIDEAESGPEAYHLNRNGYGFQSQPMTQYLTDFKNFKENYETNFEFFRGVFYPIADIDTGSYNNIYNACVLHGFAAIEGGPTYNLQEISSLGVTYAEERRFHWHLDPAHPNYSGSGPVANPYSKEANTPVPNTAYNLQGLKDFGWIGSYDKDQPASSVFSSTSFGNELDEYLAGDSTSSLEYVEVTGTCEEVEDICFTFSTKDDSTAQLASNIATFCFKLGLSSGAPTVSDNSGILRISEFTFNKYSFTKNFSDPDGETYGDVIIKSLPSILQLMYLNRVASVGERFPADNSSSLRFVLDDRYAIYGGNLYDFQESQTKIIEDYEATGYVLKGNDNGVMTFYRPSIGNFVNVFGTRINNSALQFTFAVTDSSAAKAESNIATFSLIPEGDVNIVEVKENQPPTIGDNYLWVDLDGEVVYQESDFVQDTDPRFQDPEGDQPYQLKILTLPTSGQLLLRGVPVVKDQILTFTTDVHTGDFKYVSDGTDLSTASTSFKFTVSDTGSKKFA
jgi:hypothetical protein